MVQLWPLSGEKCGAMLLDQMLSATSNLISFILFFNIPFLLACILDHYWCSYGLKFIIASFWAFPKNSFSTPFSFRMVRLVFYLKCSRNFFYFSRLLFYLFYIYDIWVFFHLQVLHTHIRGEYVFCWIIFLLSSQKLYLVFLAAASVPSADATRIFSMEISCN